MDKLEQAIGRIKPIDKGSYSLTQKRLDNLTKPLGSLGRLEELAKQLVAITGKDNPSLKNKVIFTMAADHGVAIEKVSAYPSDVTAQMVLNFLNGGAGINVLARQVGARVVVVDMGVASDLPVHPLLVNKKVDRGTMNMADGPAMSNKQAIQCLEAGIEVFEEEFKKGIDLVGTGDMGIGNTTAASAITATMTQEMVELVTGRGTGLDDAGLDRKIMIIKKAFNQNVPKSNDPMDVLRKVGGYEIGGLAGLMLAAAAHRVPVVVDGFISGSAMLIACALQPLVRDYLIPAHKSQEPGHQAIYTHLEMKPLLDLNLRLGEGTGAALAMPIVEAAVSILAEMATFDSAHVSTKDE